MIEFKKEKRKPKALSYWFHCIEGNNKGGGGPTNDTPYMDYLEQERRALVR